MKRRDFLRTAGVSGAGILAAKGMAPATAAATTSTAGSSGTLTGFIVSDAHFGWENEQQPAPKEQREMMRRIMARFPDLDVFIDTGDAHHNGLARDTERGQWAEIIADGCGAAPFYYVPGNHEINHANRDDPETRCQKMGSLECRPYYSFDIKGIHFISLPELIRAVYVNRESLEWLALDLEANRDRTTILLSHNNITGTTGPFEEGYRGLVNSEELLAIFRRFPNIIGWLHGHNHNYQAVQQRGMLFVSNGRIGGFDPSRHEPRGPYGLGGIWFAVRPDAFAVRSYSAEDNCFLDERGITAVSAEMPVETTLDPAAPAAYSFGFGGMRDGQRIPVYHHHAAGEAELMLRSESDRVFNDDPEIALHMIREGGGKRHHQIIGFGVSGPTENYTWLDPGLRIERQQKTDAAVSLFAPRHGHCEYTYYRCAPGKTYTARLDLDAGNGGQQVMLCFRVHDGNGKHLYDVPLKTETLRPGSRVIEATAQLPEDKVTGTLYEDPVSDTAVHLMLEAVFSNLTDPVTVRRMTLAMAGEKGDRPALLLGDTRYAPDESGNLLRMPVAPPDAARTLCQVEAGGSGRISWLIRRSGIDWQVRNAPIADHGQYLEIGPMRNPWLPRPEIILAQFGPADPAAVQRLVNVTRARVYPLNRGNGAIKVEILETVGKAEVLFRCARKPAAVEGALESRFENGILRATAASGAILSVSL